MSFLGRIRESLSRTTQQIVDRFDEIARRVDDPERRARAIDVETLDALEELLITADVGVAASERIVAAIRNADTGLTPPGYRLTASVGYALVQGEGEGDVDSLLEAADRRLRRAKGEGKDRWDAGSEVGVHVQAT